MSFGIFGSSLTSGLKRHAVVVGAGIVGASTAWHLARKGFDVTIIDREKPRAAGDGASGGNAGLLSIGHYPLTRPGVSWRGLKWMFSRTAPLYIKPRIDRELVAWLWNFHLHCNQRYLDRCMEVLCAMGWQTLDVLEKMIAEENIACDYARDGWLDVVLRRENMAAAEAEARSLEKFGYAWERIEGDDLRRRNPCFSDEVAGAIHMKDSAHCAPHDLIAGLLDALPRHGVKVRFDSAVRAFRQSKSGAVTGVMLDSGEIVPADAVVLAAGVWSDGLARLAGVRIPMQGARGYHLQFDYPEFDPPPIPSTGMVLHETFVAITPMKHGDHQQLRLAGTLEIGPLGQPWMPERLGMLVKGSKSYLRGLDRLKPAGEWAGYRPCTSDGMPVVGGVRSKPGLFVATGHAMMGMTLGPVTGKAMAEIVAGEKPCFDVSMLGAERF
jgi:D-amino-acid dehydrogenase